MKWEEKKKINLRTSFQQRGKAENNTQIHLSPLRSPITKIHSPIFTVPGARQLQLMSERVLPELQQHPPAFLQLQV